MSSNHTRSTEKWLLTMNRTSDQPRSLPPTRSRRLRLLLGFCVVVWSATFIALLTSTILSIEYDTNFITFGWNVDPHLDRGVFALVLWEHPKLSAGLGLDYGWHAPGLDSRCGIDWRYLGPFTGTRVGILRIPWWLILSVTGLPTLWLLRLNRRAQRRPPHHCVECQYDLRGITSARCPECGSSLVSSVR